MNTNEEISPVANIMASCNNQGIFFVFNNSLHLKGYLNSFEYDGCEEMGCMWDIIQTLDMPDI